MSEAIRLENAVKTAPDGRREVNGASFTVGERERVLVRGAPGGGYTALMRLIAGMDAPDEGKVLVLGRPVHGMGGREAAMFRSRTVGVCLREPCLMPCLTVWENVALPLAAQGVQAARRKKIAMEQLRALGIAYIADALPAQLKPYEAKLAALARALAAKPPILLLEEMTAELPENQAERLDGVLRALLQYGGATVMLFAAGENSLPMDRRFMMEHGTIREELQ